MNDVRIIIRQVYEYLRIEKESLINLADVDFCGFSPRKSFAILPRNQQNYTKIKLDTRYQKSGDTILSNKNQN